MGKRYVVYRRQVPYDESRTEEIVVRRCRTFREARAVERGIHPGYRARIEHPSEEPADIPLPERPKSLTIEGEPSDA